MAPNSTPKAAAVRAVMVHLSLAGQALAGSDVAITETEVGVEAALSGGGVARIETLTVDATSGHFTATYGAQTTASILATASAAAVQAALEALSTLAPGDVTVTGGPGNDGGTTPYTVSFVGPILGVNSALTATDVDLAGGGTTVVVTNVQAARKLTLSANNLVDLQAIKPGRN